MRAGGWEDLPNPVLKKSPQKTDRLSFTAQRHPTGFWAEK